MDSQCNAVTYLLFLLLVVNFVGYFRFINSPLLIFSTWLSIQRQMLQFGTSEVYDSYHLTEPLSQ